jgi:hypothetical protein
MSVASDLLAAVFRRAAAQDFAASAHWSFLAGHIAEDQELLDIAAVAQPGHFPPYLLLAATHQLVLEHAAPALEPFYPSVGGLQTPNEDFWRAFRAAALHHRDRLMGVVARRHVNKTVLRRCACLRPLLIEAARRLEADRVHLVDIGSSAGLNLFLDRWGVIYGPDLRAGPAETSVTVTSTLRSGAPPLDGMPEIVTRVGLDLDRIDMAKADDRTWILANLFPDDPDFAATAQAAQDLLHSPPRFVVGDATATLARTIAELDPSIPVVLMHSMMVDALSTRQRALLFSGARGAAKGRRVARISFERTPAGDVSLALAAGDILQSMPVGRAEVDAKWFTWEG